MTNFKKVADMNVAFNNPKGDALNIDWGRVSNQCLNILDEFGELEIALGADEDEIHTLIRQVKEILSNCTRYAKAINLKGVRDALCDIHVFAYGAHHFMGIDADRDMNSVVSAVMTRFIKDDADKEASIASHAAKGVTQVYFQGAYPVMVMKSAANQPDAPKGKFLKSASYSEPVFYDVANPFVSQTIDDATFRAAKGE